jgi:hypothetical protein
MQSYSVYTVSEFLKDRHPFIDDGRYKKLIDPDQVAIAYNERAIPKLADLLIYKELSCEKRRDALITLNELVSHQETKTEMIENRIVLSACNLLVDDDYLIRSEAAKLIGSLLFLDIGREQFKLRQTNYKLLQHLIFDEKVEVRNSLGWLVYRLSLHKEGVHMIVDSDTLSMLVESFKCYLVSSKIKENINYMLYLLESFINISMYDFGIELMLGKNLLKIFNRILENNNEEYSSELTKGYYEQLTELILNTFKNITLTKPGKKESINEHLIYTMNKFLDSSIEKERLFSSAYIMCVSNSLEGKKQISNYNENNSNYIILEVNFYNFINK